MEERPQGEGGGADSEVHSWTPGSVSPVCFLSQEQHRSRAGSVSPCSPPLSACLQSTLCLLYATGELGLPLWTQNLAPCLWES